MFVRVRFHQEKTAAQKRAQSASYVSALGGLVVMLAVSCCLLAIWRLTWDLGWTNTFVISEGILSHWQVWMGLTIVFGALALRLMRYGRQHPELATQAATVPAADETRNTAPSR